MSKKTLVLGASLKAIRYSNIAIKMLRDYNHEVIAFGLRKGMVHDVEIITDIENLKNEKIDTITLYLNAKRQKEFYAIILELNPNRVIFNPGTENEELMVLLDVNEIEYEIACTLVLLRTSQF